MAGKDYAPFRFAAAVILRVHVGRHRLRKQRVDERLVHQKLRHGDEQSERAKEYRHGVADNLRRAARKICCELQRRRQH